MIAVDGVAMCSRVRGGCNSSEDLPAPEHALHRILRKSRISGPMVHDARIAAVCLAHGVEELWSVDRDFSRFPELKSPTLFLRSPLEESYNSNPEAQASPWNILTVSSEYSSKSRPTSESFLRISLVAVMIWHPISSAWNTFSNSRGLAQINSALG